MDEELDHFRRSRLLHAFTLALGDVAHAKALHIMTIGTPPDLADALIEDHARERRAAGDNEDAIAEECERLRAAYLSQPNLLPDERSGNVQLLAQLSVQILAQLWLDVLQYSRKRLTSDMHFLALLDDAMLPPMDADSADAFFRTCFVHTGFARDEILDGLRLIRKNIGGGALLHPDAVAILNILTPDTMLA